MVVDTIDKARVKSINDIGHVMGMKAIAEFVVDGQFENELISELHDGHSLPFLMGGDGVIG